MNRCIVISLMVLSYVVGFAQSKSDLEQLKKIPPPNCRFLYDSLYIDETEIANIHYLEYMHYLAKDSSELFFESQLPDTTVWDVVIEKMDSSAKPFYEYYLRYPGFRYFPITGITYDQAVNYCKWRSTAVNQFFNNSAEYLKKYPILKDYEIIFEYRLPSIDEWEYAASGGLNTNIYPLGQVIDLTKGYKANAIRDSDCIKVLKEKQFDFKKTARPVEFNVIEDYLIDDKTSVTCDVTTKYIYEYKPNGYGLFNMIGNVAEMTSSKGIAKGGSLINSLYDISIQKDYNYNKPEFWLGFRCVCTVRYRKKGKSK